MIRVGLVGHGYWGRNLARCLDSAAGIDLRVVCDSRPGALETVGLGRARRDYHPAGWDVDAVVVATPAGTHADTALKALRAGKHVLVEKPLATSVEDARMLALAAECRGLVLMVDHTFAYSPVVLKAREYAVDRPDGIGRQLYFDSTRINLGTFQPDIDVVWDLAPHDLAILHELVPGWPLRVSAVGHDPLGYGCATGAHLALDLKGGVRAHVHVNWVSPVKVRRTLLAGDLRMLVLDDTEPTDKLRVYDTTLARGIRQPPAYRQFVDYRLGDVTIPRLDDKEALMLVVEEFRDAIVEGRPARTGAAEGIEAVRILEAASRSMRSDGVWVTV